MSLAWVCSWGFERALEVIKACGSRVVIQKAEKVERALEFTTLGSAINQQAKGSAILIPTTNTGHVVKRV